MAEIKGARIPDWKPGSIPRMLPGAGVFDRETGTLDLTAFRSQCFVGDDGRMYGPPNETPMAKHVTTVDEGLAQMLKRGGLEPWDPDEKAAKPKAKPKKKDKEE